MSRWSSKQFVWVNLKVKLKSPKSQLARLSLSSYIPTEHLHRHYIRNIKELYLIFYKYLFSSIGSPLSALVKCFLPCRWAWFQLEKRLYDWLVLLAPKCFHAAWGRTHIHTILTQSPSLPGPHSWRALSTSSCGACPPQTYCVHSLGWQDLPFPGLVLPVQPLPPFLSLQDSPCGPPHRLQKR